MNMHLLKGSREHDYLDWSIATRLINERPQIWADRLRQKGFIRT